MSVLTPDLIAARVLPHKMQRPRRGVPAWECQCDVAQDRAYLASLIESYAAMRVEQEVGGRDSGR